jgi:protocatechuate 3,4-dioxygenase alpha subunit
VSDRLPTPSQTVGPFFHDCLLRDDARCDAIVDASGSNPAIRIVGRVVDGDGAGVPDAAIEVWQAAPSGAYTEARTGSSFAGFARIGTDESGGFSFTTVKPGRVPYDDTSLQAPHLNVAVFARGLLNHLFTRIYFEDEPATATDPILGLVPAARRSTLVARVDAGGEVASLTRTYRFDIVLQGEGETAFLDFVARRP